MQRRVSGEGRGGESEKKPQNLRIFLDKDS